MKKLLYTTGILFLFLCCDKKNEDLVMPLSASGFPQVVVLAGEGDGNLEDEDHFSFKIALADAKKTTLDEEVTVQFAITGYEGFARLQDYILDAEAFYEIDDCTNSLDKGIDLNLQFNRATGTGTVRFPKGVEEIEIGFETDPDIFDDDIVNDDERSISLQLTGMTGGSGKTAVNQTAAFTYTVLDDEAIYGEWELDVNDAVAFARFKALFGLIDDEIGDLQASDVEEITLSVEYDEVKATVVLKETETVTECGDASVENKVIEIEAGIEALEDDEIEFGETLELNDGSFRDFMYKGSFSISGGTLHLTLEGEFDDETTDEITLELEK